MKKQKETKKMWLIGYADPRCKVYKPKMNRKRQAGLFSLMLADIILPATFGIGFIISNLITKYRPLFLYS
jgi:hypothetical protein